LKLKNEIIKSKKFIEDTIETNKSKNYEITSSMNYAHEIQKALLPREESIKRCLPLSFTLYKPKDIVGGDFFWFHKIEDGHLILICADCTGHGIPGALMTILGNSALHQVIIEKKIYEPSKILTELDKIVTTTLKQKNSKYQTIQDGMDISIVNVNKNTKEILFGAAKHKSVLFLNGKLVELKGDRCSIGGQGDKTFSQQKYNFGEDDALYLFSDGYIDQFGGLNDKKFSTSRLLELLSQIHQNSIPEQQKTLENTISDWMGTREQTDDITLIGIKF
jgi:serine phosphatase RsbU (regulator of sigma subunit)